MLWQQWKQGGEKAIGYNIISLGGSGGSRNVIYLSNIKGGTRQFFGIDDQLEKVDGLRITRGH